jgi:quercetin dioxygenase-like cupin family protein
MAKTRTRPSQIPKNAPIQITEARSTPKPAENFTGLVEKLEIIDAPAPARVHVLRVKFQPGARTFWHTHPLGQTLVVTEGHGWVQQRGGEKKEISVGDVVWIPREVEHWHGATPTEAMTHVAVQERKIGEPTD